MNDRTLDYLMRKMENRRASYSSRDMRNSRDGNDYRQMRDSASDSRDMRGSRGNVEFEGNMDFRDRRDYSYDMSTGIGSDMRDYVHGSSDMRDYARGSRDTHKMRLSKTDMHDWKQRMENEDGTRGAHYSMDQIMSVADKLGIKFSEFDEKEFCIAVNMMYSDYCKVAKHYVSPDKEIMFFADFAKAFLEDEDAPEGSEKLALYYHCIVDA